jgi:ABC-type multidrug transport system fused ATPase/permease subunit
MTGIKVVKAFGAEKLEQERFEEASNAAFASAYAARSNVALYGILGFVMASIPVLAANSYLAVWAAEKQGIAAGAALAFTGFAVWNLGAFNYAMGRMLTASGAVRRLLSHWGVVQDMTVAMERAFSQVDLDPEVQDAEDAEELSGLEREVSFEAVSFAYQQDRPVLQEVSLTAKAGSITALVGPTGSGKSTLVSLLLRLFDPDAGSVAIDGKDIKRFTIDSLRARIGIALQENLLFGTSIRENIRYAVPEASDAAVREAARIACADEFIERQPEGYDTPLGERGSKLSTGQRQRLSIARAIIKDTPVLVLDEPTASLDAETELRVLENLHAWGAGRAIFLITHRLSTIRQADHIVYLRDGRVLEQGSHAELMAREGGAYRRFVELEEGHHNEGTTPLPRQEAAS